MLRFKTWLSVALLFLSLPSQAQFKKITEKEFNHWLAKKFVQDRATEFNQLQKLEGAPILYQLFLPRAMRSTFKSSWADRPTMKAEDTTLVIEFKNHPSVRMEVVDLLKQKYKINGQPFTRAWFGNQTTDAELLTKLIQKNKGYSLNELVLPKSEALVWMLPALYALIVGVEATADVAAGAAVIDGVATAVTVAGARTAATEVATAAAARAATTEATIGAREAAKVVVTELKNDPLLRAELRAELLKDVLTETIKAPTPAKSSLVGRFAIWVGALSGTAGVTSTVSQTLSYANSKDANYIAAALCEFSTENMSLDACLAAQRGKVKETSDAALTLRTHYSWCYNEKANEIQGTANLKDGRTEVFVTRYDEKRSPVLAMRFVIDKHGYVEGDSIRQYALKIVAEDMSQDLRFLSPKQLAIKDGARLKQEDVFPKPLDDTNKTSAIIDDMAKKIETRDRLIKENTIAINPAFDNEELIQFQRDKKAIKSEGPRKQEEFAIISEFKMAEAQLRGQCKGIADAAPDPKTVEAASVPGADTATAIKEGSKQ